MNTMTYKGYDARLGFSDEDDLFIGHLTGIDDIVGFHASTVQELRAAFHEAVDDYIESCAKIGKDPQRPYSGAMTLRVDHEVYKRAVHAAELAGKSLDQWGEEVLDQAARSHLSVPHLAAIEKRVKRAIENTTKKSGTTVENTSG